MINSVILKTTLLGWFFLFTYIKTVKRQKKGVFLYIYLKKSKKIFIWTKTKKMLFCCFLYVNYLIFN